MIAPASLDPARAHEHGLSSDDARRRLATERAVVLPVAHPALRTVGLSAEHWAIAFGAAIAGTTWMQGSRWIARMRSSNA